MMSETKRKWILRVAAVLLIAAPFVLLGGWTLDEVQRRIWVGATKGQIEEWMPVWQARVAYIYRYTMRDEASAKAFKRYMRLFYERERNGDDEVAQQRAADAIYDYAGVLDDLNLRPEACYYFRLFLQDWPSHDKSAQAFTRAEEFRRQGNDRGLPPTDDDD